MLHKVMEDLRGGALTPSSGMALSALLKLCLSSAGAC